MRTRYKVILAGAGAVALLLRAQTPIPSPTYDVRAFQFSFTSGSGVSGSLSSAGAGKVLTFTRGPKGLAYSANYPTYIYISGGTGTAEAALITATTCPLSGGTACTATVTTANTHSGAWTASSIASGIPEALSATGGNGRVIIAAPLPSPIAVHGPISAPSLSGGHIVIEGQGQFSYAMERASDFLAGNLFSFANIQTSITFRDLGIDNNPTGASMTGAAIYASNTANVTTQNGWLAAVNTSINGGQYGIRAVGTTVNLTNAVVYSMDTAYKPLYGVSLEGPYSVGVTRPASNHVLNDVKVFSGSVASANVNTAGMYLNGVDGLTATNLLLQGDHGLLMHTTSNNYNTLVLIDQMFIDHARSDAVRLSSDGTGSFNRIVISNSHLGGAVAGPGVDLGSTVTANITGLRFVNNDIELNYTHGIIGKPSETWTISGNHILTNNTSNTANTPGIYLPTCSGAGHVISDNVVANDVALGTGHTTNGLRIDVACDVVVAGNDFSAVDSTPLLLGAALTGIVSGNRGVNDTSTAVVAAGTLDLPATANFTMSGTTGVTAVTTNWPAGMTGTFIGSGAAFTAGASIGNSGTAAGNKLYNWYWDGAKLFINGPGF